MFPRTREAARAAAELNYAEVLKSGCTTLVELGSPNALGNKEAVELPDRNGIRAYLLKMYGSGSWHTPDGNRVLYTNFDGETWDEAPGFKGLDESVAFIEEYDSSADGRIRCLLGPSTVDMCSKALLRESRKKADEMGVGLQTHVSQSVVEFQEIMRRHGMTPIEFLHDVGPLARAGIPESWRPTGYLGAGINDKYHRNRLDAGLDLVDRSILEWMLRTAEERYGREEVERLKPFLGRLSEAIWKVQGFELEPGDEPPGDPGEDR